MPTRGRREYARLAVDCFLAQDYPKKELVILDDEDCPSFAETPTDPRIRYKRLPVRMSIAEKRNQCCEMAAGDLICHFDSDDWSSPDRVSSQVKTLLDSGKSLAGYHAILFYEPAVNRALRYAGFAGINLGSSYLYKRSLWTMARFTDRGQRTEDYHFMRAADREFVSKDGSRYLVARIHSDNTSHKDTSADPWRPASISDLPAGFPR